MKPKKKLRKRTTGAERRAKLGRVIIAVEVTPEQKSLLRVIAFARNHPSPAALLRAMALDAIQPQQ